MDPPFSEEELALLIHGNPGFGKSIQLSLSDFMSLASPPDWIAPDKWEDILTYSVLPGGLESICVAMADDSESWYTWCNLKEPEVSTNFIKNSIPQSRNAADQAISDIHCIFYLLEEGRGPSKLVSLFSGCGWPLDFRQCPEVWGFRKIWG